MQVHACMVLLAVVHKPGVRRHHLAVTEHLLVIGKSAGTDARDGAVVPFERVWQFLV